MNRHNTTIAACFLILSLVCCSPATAAIIINHTATDLSQIPDQWITQAKTDLHIAYQHTSHGSQLITGMSALQRYPDYETKYSWTDAGSTGTLDLDDGGIPGCSDLSVGDSIDGNNVTPWVTATRTLLNNPANSHVNVIVWSWCSINGHNAQRYVDNMEILIAQYPNVKFVFMTGHAEGQGEDLTLNSVHYNNQLIRNHCATHDRILFDFADIEAYNPVGTYYWDKDMEDNLDYTGGNWAVQWIAANPAHELTKLTTGTTGYSGCNGCAHSDSPTEANLNCVLKARAVWSLWARLAGWNGLDNSTSTTTTITGTSSTTTTSGTTTTTIGSSSTTTTGSATTTIIPADDCIDNDSDTYGENCIAGPDCNDDDAFLHDICPTCTVRVIPKTLGWFLGDRERTHTLIVIGNRDAEYDDNTIVRWETDAIEVLKKRVFFKRFMLLKVRIDGATLDKVEYRALIGDCLATLTMQR